MSSDEVTIGLSYPDNRGRIELHNVTKREQMVWTEGEPFFPDIMALICMTEDNSLSEAFIWRFASFLADKQDADDLNAYSWVEFREYEELANDHH